MGAVMTEAALHEQIWKLMVSFKRHDVLAFHVPNGALRHGMMGTRHMMGVVPGAPDFVIIIAGRAHFLELKSEKGKLSHAQSVFSESAQAAGATYDVVRSLDEACTYLNRIGAMRVNLTSGVRGRTGAQPPADAPASQGNPFTEGDRARA